MAEKKAKKKSISGGTRRSRSQARDTVDASSPSGDGAEPKTRTPANSPPTAAPTRDQLAERARVLAVRDDEDPWSEAELAEVTDDLTGEANRLRAEIDEAEVDLADLLQDGGEGAGDDQADAGSAAFEREHELSLARNAQAMLAQVEHALARIDDTSYGTCERCGEPIGKARLLAFPRATLCMACKQLEERR